MSQRNTPSSRSRDSTRRCRRHWCNNYCSRTHRSRRDSRERRERRRLKARRMRCTHFQRFPRRIYVAVAVRNPLVARTPTTTTTKTRSSSIPLTRPATSTPSRVGECGVGGVSRAFRLHSALHFFIKIINVSRSRRRPRGVAMDDDDAWVSRRWCTRWGCRYASTRGGATRFHA